MLPSEISLRPITEADMPFLYALYANTREDELAVVVWSPEEKATFLTSQFWAQHTYYQEHYADAHFDIILKDGQPIGRFYLQRRPDEYRLMDIALVAEMRNQGIGSRFMRDLLEKATAEGVAVRLHVENYNPAYRLYTRFGFQPLGENGVYTFMEWLPNGVSQK